MHGSAVSPAVHLFALATGLASLLSPAHAGDRRFTPIGPEGGEVHALTLDPADARIVYAVGPGAGIFKSRDGAASWELLPLVAPGPFDLFNDLAVDPFHPATLYAAVGGAVYRSGDGGGTWTPACQDHRGGNPGPANRP